MPQPDGRDLHHDKQRVEPALRYRSATSADVDLVVALVESAYRGASSRAGWTTEADLLDGTRTHRDEVSELISGAGSRIVLAETTDGDTLGCCHLALRPDGSAYFGMFAVSPTRQSHGIGRGLLDEAERLAREAGCQTMRMSVLDPRTDLISWYERRGYRLTGGGAPFPDHDPRFGLPRVAGLRFADLAKPLGADSASPPG